MKYLGPLFTFILMFILVYAAFKRCCYGYFDGVSGFQALGGYCFFFITIRQLLDIERHG